MADKVQFIDVDADVILSEMIAYYQQISGRVLQPAQAERLLINTFAYREMLLRNQLNEGLNQNLVSFSTGIALEYLGELVGVQRLPAQAAECIIRFTLVVGHGPLLVSNGIKVQSVDGQAVFITTEDKNVTADALTVDIKARCTKDGAVGNDYEPGDVAIILDPQPYISAAANTDKTAGGSDQETDEELRERIRLAPSIFSVAGPTGAYEFFARKAHPLIVDVRATIGHDEEDNVIPGQVDIFPLLEGNQDLTEEITDAILAQCNDDKVRPLTDTVMVKSPTKIDYALEVDITLLNDAVEVSTLSQVNSALQAYIDARKNKLGIDVVISQIIGKCQINGIYKAEVTSPADDIVCNERSFTNCTGITVNVVGTSDE